MIEYINILGDEIYKILFVLIPVLVSVAMIVWLDRRIWGLVQKRRGPNVVGPFGLFQTLADALKYMLKEVIIPASANKPVFILAPIITMTLALIAWAVIPMSEDLILSDINVGLLYLFAVSSLGVYGIIMGGWASNSKYPFLGAIRSAAQMVSYEVSIGIIIINVLLCVGSLNLKDIVLEMMSYAEGCTISAKKDGLVNIGGLLCTNNDSLAKKEKDLLILTEGYPTYGGLAGRDLDAMSVGLKEVMDEDYLQYRLAQAKYLGEHLMSIGYDTIQPPGGHAIYIDAKSTLDHIPPLEFPGHALAIELYKTGGIRSCEIGTVMFGKIDKVTGKEIPAKMELLRLALPRRTHTQSHIDYVIEVIKEVYDNRKFIKGLKIIKEPKFLRHFSAKLTTIE